MKRLLTVYLLLALAVLAIFISGGCGPLLYEPRCNSDSLLSLKVPEHIDTLARYPRDKTYLENGIDEDTGSPAPDHMKEMFDASYERAKYHFFLFFDDAAAKEDFESSKKLIAEDVPIFSEVTRDGITFCLFQVERPRSDPEGGWRPLSFYISRAYAKINNLVVDIEVHHKELESDALTRAVEHLADTLKKALSEEDK